MQPSARDSLIVGLYIMIPFTLTQTQFTVKYRRFLDHESHRIIDVLRTLLRTPVPESVTAAEVEFFLDEDGDASPSAWIYFDGKEKKVDSDDQSIFAGRSLKIIDSLKGLDEFDPRYFTDEDFGGMNLAANVLKAWFAECWWKANGWAYRLPVTVFVHDGYGDGQGIKLTESS